MQAFINGAGNAIQGAGTARTLHIPILPNTTYTVSKVLSARFIIGTFESYEIGSVGTQRVITYTNQTSGNITTGANDKYLCVFYYLSTADTLSEETIRNSIQIEVGSTATSFTAHREEDYDLDLPGQNLAVMNHAFPYTDRAVTYYYDGEKFELSGTANNNNIYMMIYTPGTSPLFKSGDTITVTNETNWEDTSRVEFLNSSSGTISGATVSRNTTTTLTFSEDVYGYRTWYNATNRKVFNGTYQKIQIDKGTIANRYTPYGTTPIELCKIGDYQDYIYKSNGKWYKHKEVKKVVLDGTENWARNDTTLGYRYRLDISDIKPNANNSATANILSNYFLPTSPDSLYNTDNYSISCFSGTSHVLIISCVNSDTDTLEKWKTWLSTHNTKVYYLLDTTTEEEITYEPLLRQLDKIDKIGLYDISNISQDNSDMKMLLDFTICNDNYNGLREFIRS